jgi:adenosylcobinamide-GDP ribazoletransferase
MPWPGLRLAVTLLTAVPLPGRKAQPAPPSRRTAAAAMYWAPAVGLGIGAVCAVVLVLARFGHAGPLLASVLAVTAGAVLTRALHLDGLADLADGLGSARPAGQALEIMKRSDVGPFGVVTLVLTLLIQVAALARADALGRGPAAVLTAAVTARLAMTLACRAGVPAARPEGLGALVAGTVRRLPAALLTVAVLAAAAAAGLAPGTSGRWIFVIGAAAGLAAAAGLTVLAVRRLGGITGDVLGALAELAATACLVVTALS